MRRAFRQLLRLGLTSSLAAATAFAGCDSSARIYQQRVTFQYAEVVSAFPGKRQADGTWERVCDAGPVDGLITNVALVSSQRKPPPNSTATVDRDQGIRPRDVVETRVVEGGLPGDIDLSTLSNIGLEFDCIDPVPSPNPGNASCQGAAPTAQLDEVRYEANNADRNAGHNVILLIDQSGSTAGLVNAGVCENGTGCASDAECTGIGSGVCTPDFRENAPSRVRFPQNFGDVASDRNDERLAVARKLLEDLNPGDQFGAMAFGEGDGTSATLTVPCEGAQGGVAQSLATCFGVNRAIWRSGGAIAALGSREGGRSNLWEAVDTAYSFLKDLRDTRRANHIIVLTDGPDTCASGEGLGGCQTSCSTVKYEAIRDRLEADLDDPNAIPIRIHFVQFESVGYRGRDPRQVEAACLSGGHYQFLNSVSFPRDQQNQLTDAMQTAMNNVRFSLMGHWQFGARVSGYVDSGPAGTSPGSLYALAGTFTIKASSRLKSLDQPFRFDVGRGGTTNIPPSWDHRPTVRKPCTAASECGAAGEGGACDIICSEETLVCPGGSSGVTAPNLFACDAPGGGAGFCCEGTCQGLGGACVACPSN